MRTFFLILTLALALASAETTEEMGDTVLEEVTKKVKASNIGASQSTYDLDLDNSESNCAVSNRGAWWYTNCGISNLNGLYLKGLTGGTTGMFWETFRGVNYSLKKSRMMLRRKEMVTTTEGTTTTTTEGSTSTTTEGSTSTTTTTEGTTMPPETTMETTVPATNPPMRRFY